MRYEELRRQKDKLFPGKIRYVDFLNERYIGRKPMYDFIMSHSVDFWGEDAGLRLRKHAVP